MTKNNIDIKSFIELMENDDDNKVLKKECLTKKIEIVTCSCFADKWKMIKENENDNWKFDEIENSHSCKTFRKNFFFEEKLFHCCYDCFTKQILLNPFQLNEKKSGICIMKKFIGEYTSLDEICLPCLLYFINNYSNCFNIL